VINEEFDTYVGAMVADLILKQHTLRAQSKANFESHGNSSNNEMSQILLEELSRTEHLVYVDTAIELSEAERDAVIN